jgi:phosphotransferase system  glucose/maltose/N-acetylglucosamine-specific IIC component
MTLRHVSILICLCLLAFGLIRIGVGGAMIGQELAWWKLGGDIAGGLADTHRFIAARETNMAGFTPLSYFVYIVLMGVVLNLGAIGHLLRWRWGLALIALYLAMHAALFVNFLTVNPKLVYLGIGVALWLALWWEGRAARDTEKRKNPA